jgi:hypothetical protein
MPDRRHQWKGIHDPDMVRSGLTITALLDGAGQPVPGSRVEKIIAREVSLDLSREFFDTRLRPGQSATLAYRPRLDTAGLRAHFSVVVEPDAFYERFFEALVRQGTGRGEGQIREALDTARRSPFTVFAQDIPLT